MRREPGGFGLSTLDLFKANQFRPIRTHLRKLFLLDERTRGVPGTAMAYSTVPVLYLRYFTGRSGEHQVFHHEREPRASRMNTPVYAVTAGGRICPAHGPRIGEKLGKNWETARRGSQWQHTGRERDGGGQAGLL